MTLQYVILLHPCIPDVAVEWATCVYRILEVAELNLEAKNIIFLAVIPRYNLVCGHQRFEGITLPSSYGLFQV
jgi:hypothetical protein